MNKQEFIHQLAIKLGMSVNKTQIILDEVFNEIVSGLNQEKKITFSGFGVFEIKTKKSYEARNPNTNMKIFVPEKKIISFRSSKNLNKRIENND